MIKLDEKPEYSSKYPAIDGIDKKVEGILVGKPIRSDIIKLFEMDNGEFEKWYSERREAAQTLLNMYELVSSVPALIYGSERMQFGMDAYTDLASFISIFEKTLDYLEKIQDRRNDYRAAKIKTGRELTTACREFEMYGHVKDDEATALALRQFEGLLQCFEDRDEVLDMLDNFAVNLNGGQRDLVLDTYDRLMEGEEGDNGG
jgi:hypothetical protein